MVSPLPATHFVTPKATKTSRSIYMALCVHNNIHSSFDRLYVRSDRISALLKQTQVKLNVKTKTVADILHKKQNTKQHDKEMKFRNVCSQIRGTLKNSYGNKIC